MKRSSAIPIIIFFSIIAIAGCNRKANKATTSDEVSQKSVPRQAHNAKKTAANANATGVVGDDAPTNPRRNPYVSDQDTVVHINKTACYGDCPVFSATILANGDSFYTGKQNVEKIGTYTAKISQRAIIKIDEKLLEIDFYDLNGRYPEDEKEIIVDLPWVYIFSELKEQKNHVAVNHSGPKKLMNFISFVEVELDKLNWTSREIKD